MRLEIDAGNTRAKWRACDHRGVFDSGKDLQSALDDKPSWLSLVEEVWVSSVHDEQNEWILKVFPQAQFAKSQVSLAGLSNSYEDVHKMGVDRWLAMLAAWSKSPDQAHIIIDAGTALTLDIIDEFGRHVGGYICPGFSLMKNSLLSGTKRILLEDNWQVGRAPGNSTQECVDRGVQDMVACWLEHHGALQPNSKIWVTGGDGQRLVSLLSKPVQYEPDLVLDGLQVHFS